MKLLICTQAVDSTDSNLGFFHRWIEEFARHCEYVVVVCLREGEHKLPSNVRVLSLGKEKGVSRLSRIVKFFSYIIENRHSYNSVFVHMNAEYVVLGGWLWHRWGKKVGLWYAHKSVTRMLQTSMRFVDVVLTSSSEGFRIQSSKVHVVGQGIDTEAFKPEMREASIETRFITTGRLAASKSLVEMLDMLDALHARGELFTFTIVGEAGTPEEEKYATRLRQEIAKRPYHAKVYMRGGLLHDNLPKVLNLQDIFLNFSITGSMDKACLEALAVGLPVLTTNEAFKELLLPFELFVPSRHPVLIADAVQKFMNRTDRAAIVATLRGKVVADHSLSKLIPSILKLLEK